MLSIVILTLISIPLMKYFSDSLRYSKLTEQRQRATILAQETIEQLKAQQTIIKRVPDLSGGGATIYGMPAMTESDTYSVLKDTDFDYSLGKGEVILKKTTSSSNMKYDVLVKLSTNIAANAITRPIVYGIDDTENVMVVEHNEEMDALWYFLQLNNAYVISQEGFASALPSVGEDESSESASESTPEDGIPAGPDPAVPAETVTMYDNINQIRALLQRDIYITFGKETVDPYYYTVQVYYEYSCKEKIAANDAGEDKYRTNDLVNDRIQTLKALYLMYNIVDPNTDKIHITWDMANPAAAKDVPDILLVCQNMDALTGSSTPAEPEETPAPGELAPVSFTEDKATVTFYLDAKLNGFNPVIRTNMVSVNESTGALDATTSKGVFKNEALNYDTSKLSPLSSTETPVRIVTIDVDIYENKGTVITDYSGLEPLVKMKTSKGE